MAKKPSSASSSSKRETLTKEELFAYAYIQNMGNATAAAREAFNIKSDAYASKKGSEMVRKGKVKSVIKEYMEKRKATHEEFVDQGSYYLAAIAHKLVRIIENDDTDVNDCFRAIELLSRLCGVELSEKIVIAQIKSGVWMQDNEIREED